MPVKIPPWGKISSSSHCFFQPSSYPDSMIYLTQFLCAWFLLIIYSDYMTNPAQFWIFAALLMLSVYGMKREISQV